MSTWSARTRLARDRRRPDGFIKPCLLTASTKIPAGPDWQFEVKHDGFRMIARLDPGTPRIANLLFYQRTVTRFLIRAKSR